MDPGLGPELDLQVRTLSRAGERVCVSDQRNQRSKWASKLAKLLLFKAGVNTCWPMARIRQCRHGTESSSDPISKTWQRWFARPAGQAGVNGFRQNPKPTRLASPPS